MRRRVSGGGRGGGRRGRRGRGGGSPNPGRTGKTQPVHRRYQQMGDRAGGLQAAVPRRAGRGHGQAGRACQKDRQTGGGFQAVLGGPEGGEAAVTTPPPGPPQAQLEAQKATQEFQRAVEILRAAKETIALAEERLLEEDTRQFDSAWQEMLNHATQRVMEAEQSRTRSELEHRKTAAKYNTAINHMKQLEKKLKRVINKSRPYFELKAQYYLQLEQLRRRVDERQAQLSHAKAEYRTALRNLESISDEIHARRRLTPMGPRGRGVGAEGDRGSADDISNFKMESDGISMVSMTFEEDGGNRTTSEDDPETCSTGSLGSTPITLPHPYPASSSCPTSLELPGSNSLEGFGDVSPVLGPRSECSGASSPECDQERGERAEGAEGKPEAAKLPSQGVPLLEPSLNSLTIRSADDCDP
ncbi:SH3 domain-binding protein 5 isoform X1 [Denticeps clupeoides]|uniref:SH3 domain-binding protein 5 isoform X1 n=1 Tax=Denticeps clupeoides TaxID=299321 RepID=UPI0010A3C1BA|nr:SH3 domain-binding protein 5-like isoform X1 [Denticeps clupeoides]